MLGHYLMFNRNCAEAMETYKRALDAEIIEMQKYGDRPPNPAFPVPEEDKELVLHAGLQLDDREIMCADSSGRSTSGDNMYVSVTTKDAALVQKGLGRSQAGRRSLYGARSGFFRNLARLFAG